MCHPRRSKQKIYIEVEAKVEDEKPSEYLKLSILKSVLPELN